MRPERSQSAPGANAGRGGERGPILIVEDDKDIAELVRFNLEQYGFAKVSVVTDGEGAIAALASNLPAIIVLDLMLPGMSGVEVCRRIRGNPATAALPIVMVSAKAAELDRILGLEMGADDYVTKPFSPRELVARVAAVLRRASARETNRLPEVYEKGRLRINFDTYEVRIDGKPVDLTLREFELLRFFVRSPNRVFDRLQILDLAWGPDAYVEPRTVDVHVRRVRARIERDDSNPELIVTVRGVGYKFDESALER